MKNKLKIEFDLQSEYTLIGISCQLKDYRLAFYINNDLKLNLKRMGDLFIANKQNNQENKFSFYYCFDEEFHHTYSLISNQNQNGKLLSTVKQIDCFFIIKDHIKTEQKQHFISSIRKIKNVIGTYELDIKKIKNADLMLSDMEIHITEILRKKKEELKKRVE
ncbi:MAG: IPExxxVDY family protein [Bacteroidales bacterium]|nr:IPExxxVDY family protein [Bacteroidales bacterium]